WESGTALVNASPGGAILPRPSWRLPSSAPGRQELGQGDEGRAGRAVGKPEPQLAGPVHLCRHRRAGRLQAPRRANDPKGPLQAFPLGWSLAKHVGELAATLLLREGREHRERV